ncbi:DUF3304 domain-containing protein [Pseudomonas sp. Irchel 3E20]|uniref:DUF3304 domain-containing protein n=1 Tax=Pseudomonas sp. Irchel 3E20 TaxID=2008983 RepID=UPI000BA4E352|nr:DUF3304 domain-containing protein [Pseudomonas sp. Irchel 3E20]
MNAFQVGRQHLRQLLSLLVLAVLLVGCKAEEPDKGSATAQISAYNHTEDFIYQFYIDGAGGASVRAYEGGGGFICCIGYPREWRPDLKATVRWTTSASNPKPYTGETWHEKVVPIEQYKELGTTLNVHFLEQGNVRLIISSMGSGHPEYPGPLPPVKPAEWPKTLYLEDLK